MPIQSQKSIDEWYIQWEASWTYNPELFEKDNRYKVNMSPESTSRRKEQAYRDQENDEINDGPYSCN